MSASKTNIETQKRRHAGPLVGMAVVVAIVILAFVGWLIVTARDGTAPQGADVQIDGRTGEPAPGDGSTSAPSSDAPTVTAPAASD